MGQVFMQFLWLGCISVGGPAAHIGYFQRTFVQRLGWLNQAEFAQLLALCQLLPGPASSQLGFAIGRHRAGIGGALAAFVGFTLPSFLLLLAAAVGLGQLAGNLWLDAALHGLKLLALVVVADAVLTMSRQFCKTALQQGVMVATAAALWCAPGLLTQVAMLLGAARYPFPSTTDFSAFLLKAQSSGAKVIAFLGAHILQDFGATIFVVELVNIAFLREFAVLLTAIVLAGRTASAFTAQIGAMKSREEIDAIRTLGLDPVDLLVIPRLLALLVMLPLLTFIAMMAGLAGGVTVGAFDLDIPPQMYLSRMHETVEVRHFLVGMSKAPVFALVIGLIGCLEGLRVEGTAQSVGERTTSSVVQTISLVIILDALAALWFMHMDL